MPVGRETWQTAARHHPPASPIRLLTTRALFAFAQYGSFWGSNGHLATLIERVHSVLPVRRDASWFEVAPTFYEGISPWPTPACLEA